MTLMTLALGLRYFQAAEAWAWRWEEGLVRMDGHLPTFRTREDGEAAARSLGLEVKPGAKGPWTRALVDMPVDEWQQYPRVPVVKGGASGEGEG